MIKVNKILKIFKFLYWLIMSAIFVLIVVKKDKLKDYRLVKFKGTDVER